MRDRLESPKPGESLSQENINRIGRTAEVLSGKHPGSFAHGRHASTQSTESPPYGHVQVLIEITSANLSTGLYQGKIVGYDSLEEDVDERWQSYGSEYVIDATGYGKDGERWAIELAVESRYPCYWNSQRGTFIPLCCGTSPSFTCIIYKDYFDFFPPLGTGSVHDPSIIPELNPPSDNYPDGDDEWFTIRQFWRRKQTLVVHFFEGEETIIGVEVPPTIGGGDGGLQYNGQAEALNVVLSKGDEDDTETWTVGNSEPTAIVLRHHPLQVPQCVISTAITLHVAPQKEAFPTPGEGADQAGILLGYRGPPWAAGETPQSTDYYYALAVAGNSRDKDRFPGKLQLWHFSSELNDDLDEINGEHTLLVEALTDSMLMDPHAIGTSPIGPGNVIEEPPLTEYPNRGKRSFFLDLCYFDNNLTATTNRARTDQSEGKEGRPGTGDVTISISIPTPLGNRVGMTVRQMERDSYADNLRFPIQFDQFEWWYHRDDELNPEEVCEFCLIECGICEIDDTPLGFLLQIEGVGNNLNPILTPNPRPGIDFDQCNTCDEDFNGCFVMHLVGTNLSSGAQSILRQDEGCCYRVAVGCSEYVEECPPNLIIPNDPTWEYPGTEANPARCITNTCFIEMCMQESSGGGGIEMKMVVAAFVPDETNRVQEDSTEDCTKLEAAVTLNQSTPAVQGLPTDATSSIPGELVTCRNMRFDGLFGNASFNDTAGSGGTICKWHGASFELTPLFKEDFDDDGRLIVDGERKPLNDTELGPEEDPNA